MSFFLRFILSIPIFAVGVLLMKYSVYITEQISGKIDFAEKYLGTGIGSGTYTWWKLCGLAACIISIAILLNKISFGF